MQFNLAADHQRPNDIVSRANHQSAPQDQEDSFPEMTGDRLRAEEPTIRTSVDEAESSMRVVQITQTHHHVVSDRIRH